MVQSVRDSVVAHALSQFDVHVRRLQDYLRIPSISTDPAHAGDVRRAAEWLVGQISTIPSASVELMETGGHPVVFARIGNDPRKKTVLFYGHYDVQPPDPIEQWNSDPFDPVIVDGHIVCRGSSDDKGQQLTHFAAVAAYMEKMGQLPINALFLIEGEEENGSKNLGNFIETHKDLLAADVVVISDTGMFAPGIPAITYGVRGLVYVEVGLTGAARDLHSGVYGGPGENAICALSRIIAGLHDENRRVTVPRFYEKVADLTKAERQAYSAIPFNEADFMKETGMRKLLPESGYTVLEVLSGRPTLEVNGIWGGYTGEGSKTIIPASAWAKISCRLVANQDTGEVCELLRQHFIAQTPSTMELTFKLLNVGGGALIPIDSIAMNAGKRALQETFGRDPLFERSGGSIPVVAMFQELLGLDSIMLGFGLDSDVIHAPNEKFELQRFRQGIEAIVRFIEIYATETASR